MVASLLAIAKTAPDGSKATLLAGWGPQSTLVMGATVRTSHSFTTPYESHDAIVSPCQIPTKIFSIFTCIRLQSKLKLVKIIRMPSYICNVKLQFQ